MYYTLSKLESYMGPSTGVSTSLENRYRNDLSKTIGGSLSIPNNPSRYVLTVVGSDGVHVDYFLLGLDDSLPLLAGGHDLYLISSKVQDTGTSRFEPDGGFSYIKEMYTKSFYVKGIQKFLEHSENNTYMRVYSVFIEVLGHIQNRLKKSKIPYDHVKPFIDDLIQYYTCISPSINDIVGDCNNFSKFVNHKFNDIVKFCSDAPSLHHMVGFNTHSFKKCFEDITDIRKPINTRIVKNTQLESILNNATHSGIITTQELNRFIYSSQCVVQTIHTNQHIETLLRHSHVVKYFNTVEQGYEYTELLTYVYNYIQENEISNSIIRFSFDDTYSEIVPYYEISTNKYMYSYENMVETSEVNFGNHTDCYFVTPVVNQIREYIFNRANHLSTSGMYLDNRVYDIVLITHEEITVLNVTYKHKNNEVFLNESIIFDHILLDVVNPCLIIS